MANEDNIGTRRLVRLEPGAEVIPGNLDCAICLIPRVDLCVDDMGFFQRIAQECVDVCGE